MSAIMSHRLIVCESSDCTAINLWRFSQRIAKVHQLHAPLAKRPWHKGIDYYLQHNTEPLHYYSISHMH